MNDNVEAIVAAAREVIRLANAATPEILVSVHSYAYESTGGARIEVHLPLADFLALFPNRDFQLSRTKGSHIDDWVSVKGVLDGVQYSASIHGWMPEHQEFMALAIEREIGALKAQQPHGRR